MVQNKRIIFKQIPDGFPKPGQDLTVETSTFDLETAPPKGGITTKNLYFSFDPYLRGRMRPANTKSYSPAFSIGEPISNFGVAQVLKSDTPKAKEGDIVACMIGGEEYSKVVADIVNMYDFYVIPKDTKVNLSYFCGVLGMPGRTAWSSLYKIGQPKKGEVIWVSAAAGPVGQIVGQLAKHEGLKVIGSVGSDDKVDFVTKQLGFDAAFNYKKETPSAAISRLAPNGIDIYYDNVGAEHLEAALDAINQHGRIVACGSISGYNQKPEERYGIKNTFVVVAKRITWQGFIVSDPEFGGHYFDDHMTRLTSWLVDGTFKAQEDVTQGIEDGPEAFVGMLQGKNFGKAVLKIADL